MIRDAAFSMQIDPSAGRISEMIPIGNSLYMVAQHGIYAVQLADQIDPERTNAAIPHVQQQVCAIGADDLPVARILLTAHTLFDQKILGAEFDREKAMGIALNILKDVAALKVMRQNLKSAESNARAQFEAKEKRRGAIDLPAIGDLESRIDAFSQKAGHIVGSLAELTKLCYPTELKQRWIDSLVRLANERYGQDAPLSKFIKDARPFLINVIEMRNMIEHPTPANRVVVHDFRLLPSGKIALPAIEFVRPNQDPEGGTVLLVMSQLIDDLVVVVEMLMAHLAGTHARPFAGIAVGVVELPEDQRANKLQRIYYGTYFGDQLVRMG
jgi:hypothetical protein